MCNYYDNIGEPTQMLKVFNNINISSYKHVTTVLLFILHTRYNSWSFILKTSKFSVNTKKTKAAYEHMKTLHSLQLNRGIYSSTDYIISAHSSGWVANGSNAMAAFWDLGLCVIITVARAK